MKCQKCEKRFQDAGNIKNYQIVCPFCNHIQELKRNIGVSRTKVRFNTKNIK